MSAPSTEILVGILLAQKSYTTVHREGFLFNSYFGQECYEIIKTAKIEQDSAQSGKPSLPDHPRPGFGNKTLAEVCRELRLDQGIILAGLKKQGISAQPDLTIKVIAAGHGKEPIQLYEALRAVVAEQ